MKNSFKRTARTRKAAAKAAKDVPPLIEAERREMHDPLGRERAEELARSARAKVGGVPATTSARARVGSAPAATSGRAKVGAVAVASGRAKVAGVPRATSVRAKPGVGRVATSGRARAGRVPRTAAGAEAPPKYAAPLSRSQERERLRAINDSPSYLRAYEDLAFLKTRELRPVRLQLELLKAELILHRQRVHSTIVVFGGTRIASPGDARGRVETLEARAKAKPRDTELARELAVARRVLAKSKYYDEAREFGRIVSMSQVDGRRDYVITTGGGPGVMEAANRGAYDVGAKSIGMNITLPHEQYPNPYITPELCFQFHYFAIRKMHLLLRAKALVAFPGGYGTLDELFETLTLVQTAKVEPLPVLLFGREFWQTVVDFQYLADEGVIDQRDLELFSFVETAAEAWKTISDYYASAKHPPSEP